MTYNEIALLGVQVAILAILSFCAGQIFAYEDNRRMRARHRKEVEELAQLRSKMESMTPTQVIATLRQMGCPESADELQRTLNLERAQRN